MASGFQRHAPSGRFKITSLSKDFGSSNTSRKVYDNIKRLKAARFRDRASSDLHCSYDSGGRRITRTPRRTRRRTAPTIATQGMLAILQPQGYPYRLSCFLYFQQIRQ